MSDHLFVVPNFHMVLFFFFCIHCNVIADKGIEVVISIHCSNLQGLPLTSWRSRDVCSLSVVSCNLQGLPRGLFTLTLSMESSGTCSLVSNTIFWGLLSHLFTTRASLGMWLCDSCWETTHEIFFNSTHYKKISVLWLQNMTTVSHKSQNLTHAKITVDDSQYD